MQTFTIDRAVNELSLYKRRNIFRIRVTILPNDRMSNKKYLE